MISEKNKISFKFNSYFPIKTVNLMRGVLITEEDGISNNYIDKIFEDCSVNGLNLNDQLIIDKVLKNLDINPKTFSMQKTFKILKMNFLKEAIESFDSRCFWGSNFFSK